VIHAVIIVSRRRERVNGTSRSHAVSRGLGPLCKTPLDSNA
jgi:hypothetical protein